MTVYRMVMDAENYQQINLSIKDLMLTVGKATGPKRLMNFSKENLALSDCWGSVVSDFSPTKEFPNSTSIPDISTWRGASLILSGRALETLEDLLTPFGELLPITCGGEPFTIFNCRIKGEVDESRSKQVIENGIVMDVEALAFNEVDVLDKLVFKSDYEGCRFVFCNEKFKSVVDNSNLKGIIFSSQLAGY